MIERVQEARVAGYKKPSAWSKGRDELEALRRDYGVGRQGRLRLS